MFSVAIYSRFPDDTIALKIMLEKYFAERQIGGRLSTCDDIRDLLSLPQKFDLYIIDLEDNKEEGIILSLETKKIDPFAHFLCIDTKSDSFFESIFADSFLKKPIDEKKFFSVLDRIRIAIRQESIIISTPVGDRKIKLNDLNYIDIRNRCLCYHLTDGAIYDGRSLRESFEKAIHPLQERPPLVLLPPSLLINVNTVEILNNDHVVFENGDTLYYPKKHNKDLEAKWRAYNKIIN